MVRCAAVVVATVLTLAGCVGIPSQGGVMTGSVFNGENAFPFAVLPSDPQQGASQQEILTDFMQAATSPEGNYEIARKFLTRGAADSWNPGASVLIREGSGTLVPSSADSLDYGVSTRASVNAAGLYTEDREQATQRLPFVFEKVDEQWRISALQDGIVLSRDNFEAAFDQHALYFFDPTYRYLIPDVRWFPSRSNVPARIVNAMLDGQATWLQQGATLTAFPVGTKLQPPLEVRSGRVTVDLSEEVANTSNLEKARMQRQLEASLGTVSVNTVTMSVRSVPIVVADPGVSNATLTPLVDSDALVRLGGEFGFATASGLAPIGSVSAKIVGVDARAVTLAARQRSAAVLGAEGAYLVTAEDDTALLVDGRPGLTAPSIDTWRYVWSAPAAAATALLATGPDLVQHEITSTLPANATLVSLDVSRDGARVLLYLNSDAGPQLKVAAILRRGGVPAGLGEPIDLPVSADLPLDASWVDDRTVVALAAANGRQTVTEFTIGGPLVGLGNADGGISIVGGNGTEQIRVRAADGTILQRRTSGWQVTGLVADVLATQQ